MAGFEYRSRPRGACVQQGPRLCSIVDTATSRSPQAAPNSTARIGREGL